MLTRIGVVVIGRDEGVRLTRCLESARGDHRTLVYVDSGSSDGSAAAAREHGAHVVELERSAPFTAARARNAGLMRLLEMDPQTEWVQFVDGDCEVQPAWWQAVAAWLPGDASIAVLCGRRRERAPRASVYNLLAIPVAAGVFYKSLGWSLRPEVSALLMSFSSIIVALNAVSLRRAKI